MWHQRIIIFIPFISFVGHDRTHGNYLFHCNFLQHGLLFNSSLLLPWFQKNGGNHRDNWIIAPPCYNPRYVSLWITMVLLSHHQGLHIVLLWVRYGSPMGLLRLYFASPIPRYSFAIALLWISYSFAIASLWVRSGFAIVAWWVCSGPIRSCYGIAIVLHCSC